MAKKTYDIIPVKTYIFERDIMLEIEGNLNDVVFGEIVEQLVKIPSNNIQFKYKDGILDVYNHTGRVMTFHTPDYKCLVHTNEPFDVSLHIDQNIPMFGAMFSKMSRVLRNDIENMMAFIAGACNWIYEHKELFDKEIDTTDEVTDGLYYEYKLKIYR